MLISKTSDMRHVPQSYKEQRGGSMRACTILALAIIRTKALKVAASMMAKGSIVA